MSDGQAWAFGIIGVLIFFALASVASNLTTLIKALRPKTSPPQDGPVYVEFGGNSDYSPRLFINSAAVTYVGLLTGEGGADVHLAGGERLSVHEDMKVVAARLGRLSDKPLR